EGRARGVKTSVIIATHRRPETLARLVQSIAPQISRGERELIVAENGSEHESELPDAGIAITHLHDPRPGKCRIQNRAIAAARGEILVFLDDDLVVSNNYLDAVEAFFATHSEYAAMAGRILPAEDPEAKAGALAVYLDLPVYDCGDNVC